MTTDTERSTHTPIWRLGGKMWTPAGYRQIVTGETHDHEIALVPEDSPHIPLLVSAPKLAADNAALLAALDNLSSVFDEDGDIATSGDSRMLPAFLREARKAIALARGGASDA